jgi:hypothetical protein
MKHIYKRRLFSLALAAILVQAGGVQAGNPDRAGQAGATELLINPWARSSGWAGANSGSIRGVEAQFLNVAGIAFTKRTEAVFSHTNYLQGSGMGINTFGLSQKVGEAGVLGISLMSLTFGDIKITTTDIPEPGLATYTPQYINLGLSYAKVFSNSIYGGMTLRIISESISNVSASGIALDAGIQYVTGTNEDRNNVKFGIALKNVGTPLEFSGDGLSTRVQAPGSNNVYELSVEQRAEGFEMPSLVNIGAAYDFNLATNHILSLAGTFTSNSFTNDQFTLGTEYRFRNILMLRFGFTYEDDIFDTDLRTTWYTGPAAGVTIDLPLGKTGKSFGIDYAFRDTNPWDGCHTMGLRFTL